MYKYLNEIARKLKNKEIVEEIILSNIPEI